MVARKTYDVGPRQGLDMAVLIGTFIIGAGGNVVLKLVGTPALIAAVFPIIVLLVYVCLCFFTSSLQIEPETVGDNSYYLGFLFTLSSLAVTLYQIRDITGIDDGANDLIPVVISGFGVALTSTIFGVFLRILLMQMRPDIVARDREARKDLAVGAREFRNAVMIATRDLKSMTVESVQYATERNAKIDALSEQHMKDAHQILAKQSALFSDTLESFSKKLSSELTLAMQSETTAAIGALKSSADSVATSLSELSQLQHHEAEALREVYRELGTASEGFKAGMAKHHTVAMDSYRTLAKRSEKITETLDDRASAVSDAASKVEQALLASADRISSTAAPDVESAEPPRKGIWPR